MEKRRYDNTTNFGELLLSVLSFLPGTTLIGLAATANVALTASATIANWLLFLGEEEQNKELMHMDGRHIQNAQ